VQRHRPAELRRELALDRRDELVLADRADL
jgi:hypothetical protein